MKRSYIKPEVATMKLVTFKMLMSSPTAKDEYKYGDVYSRDEADMDDDNFWNE